MIDEKNQEEYSALTREFSPPPSPFPKWFRRKAFAQHYERLAALEQSLLQQKTDLAQQTLELEHRIDAGKIHAIHPAQIAPSPHQPRKAFDTHALSSLAASIRQNGILQPLLVRAATGEGTDGYYDEKTSFVLVAGERRLRAAQMLGMQQVPCIILQTDADHSAALTLIENMQREDLNIFEQACAIASLIDLCQLTQQQAAKRLGVSQSFVANKLRILRLSQGERAFILETGMTERHARAFLRIQDGESRRRIIAQAARRKMNVAQTEELVERFLQRAEHGEPEKPKRRFIIKDIRLFFNTVDRAISVVRDAGINIDSQRQEEENGTQWIIRIPKIS